MWWLVQKEDLINDLVSFLAMHPPLLFFSIFFAFEKEEKEKSAQAGTEKWGPLLEAKVE